MTDRDTSKQPVWSSYPETVLYFAGEPEAMIDLRESVPPATKKALPALGLDGEFAILTSYNPRGKNLSEGENTSRFEELEAELRSQGMDYIILDACSPDRAHCECSVAIKTSLSNAVDIAKRWEQIAIFWWDLERFWIYGGIASHPPISLPVSTA